MSDKQSNQSFSGEVDFSVLGVQETLDHLSTNVSGLTETQVSDRTKKYGKNIIPDAKRASPLVIFLKQFKSLLVYVLLIAAALSYITGNPADSYIILAVVLIDAIIGFVQEWRAEKAVVSLRNMLSPSAKVFRDGQLKVIDGSLLVPGDIIALEEGDNIPADVRLVEAKNVRTIEAALTGESLPVSKIQEPIAKVGAIADKKNMAWKGTFMAGGYAKAVVVHTGIHTAMGNIALHLKSVKPEKSHFQKKIDRLASQMAVASLVSATLLFGVAYFTLNLPMDELLLIAIAAMVSIIPEGLPSIIAIVLAIGSKRMTRKKAIVREFTATETLGAVTTIITDKTGTLTENALTVRRIFLFNEGDIEVTGEGWIPTGNFIQNDVVIDPSAMPGMAELLKIATHCNNATVRHQRENNSYELIGDPTEGALLVLARKGAADHSHPGIERIDDLPFSSNLKLRATLVNENNKRILYVIGAPEMILSLSVNVESDRITIGLDDQKIASIRSKINLWSSQAMRVIALAKRDYEGDAIVETEIRGLTFVGLTGMLDPPRVEAKESVRLCKKAGIRIIMATGDHISTAVSIARSVGIIGESSTHDVLGLTGDQLHSLDDEEFDDAIKKINVFARLNPDMKFRIASRLQEMGELIAMTGDGVNDAPALKKADVGIAMGIMGTDVARECAKVVLADDNFATIVNAIEEGRIVFLNARQASFYLITTNLAEITTLIAAVSFGLPVPLTAIQILWLNLVTDGIGDMALAAERGHGDALNEKPKQKEEKILDKSILPFLVINVTLMAGLSMWAYRYFMHQGIENARTAVFIVMSFTQLFNLYNMRSLKKSIFEIGFFSNIYVTITMVSSTIITVLITEIPVFKTLFGFGTITGRDFSILVAASSLVLWCTEIYKYIQNRKP